MCAASCMQHWPAFTGFCVAQSGGRLMFYSSWEAAGIHHAHGCLLCSQWCTLVSGVSLCTKSSA